MSLPARTPRPVTPRAERPGYPSLASIVKAGPSRGCFRAGALFGVLHRARLADDRDLDLTGVLQRVLDLLRDVARETRGLEVVELLRLDHDADLPTRLDGERLL